MHGIFRGIAFTSFLALSACSAMLKEPPGITYAESVLQLGITPVYPPREDIQVGDIYAVEAHTYDDYYAKNALVTHHSMTSQVGRYLKSRYQFANSSLNGTNLAPPAKDAPGNKSLPSLSDLSALPITSFPEIEVNSGVSVGVGGQPTGLLASFGLVAAKTLRMSLKYELVTSYEVFLEDGTAALYDFCTRVDRVLCTNVVLSNYLNQKYQLGPSNPDRVTSAGIMMVTKVYLARGITYTFNDAQLAAATALAVGKDGTTGTTPTVTQEMLDTATKAANPEVLTALAAIMAASTEAAKSAGEGAFKIAGITASTVKIQEKFIRPVVIGYEAVSLTPSPEKR
jgi:hypothetical protein